MKSSGKSIETLLRESKATQIDLGASMGLSGGAISHKLAGRRGWSKDEIDAALRFFSERLGRLVTYEEAFGEGIPALELQSGDYVKVTLPTGEVSPGRVRDIDAARGEVWVFLAKPYGDRWHDASGSYTARMEQVTREEAA